MEIWKKRQELALDGYYVNDQMICFLINDGRALSLSVSLFAELNDAEHNAIRNCVISADNQGLEWPDFNLTVKFTDYLTP